MREKLTCPGERYKMDPIIEKLLSNFKGFDLVVLIAAILCSFAIWHVLAQKNKKTAYKQILSVLVIMIISVIIIFFHKKYVKKQLKFSDYNFGVLVLQFQGDKENSFQKEFISGFNNELSRIGGMSEIIIKSVEIQVDEGEGIEKCHQLARDIGEAYNADLVIWGNVIREHKFFPRLTVTKSLPDFVLRNSILYYPLSISEFTFDRDLSHHFLSVALAVTGLASYLKGDYNKALNYFEFCFHDAQANLDGYFNYLFYLANCHSQVSISSEKPLENLLSAIEYYELALETESLDNFNTAAILCNLGAIYSEIRPSDSDINLLKSINFYNDALKLLTDDQTSLYYLIKQNRGAARLELAHGTNHKNIEEAEADFKSALLYFENKNDPRELGRILLNFSAIYILKSRNEASFHQQAMDLINRALMIFKVDDEPIMYSIAINNLAALLSDSAFGDALQNKLTSIRLFEDALKIRKRDLYPYYWARTTFNLGSVYYELLDEYPTESFSFTIEQTVSLLESSFEYFNRNKELFWADWQKSIFNLCSAYLMLLGNNSAANTNQIMTNIRSTLAGIDKKSNRDLWFHLRITEGMILTFDLQNIESIKTSERIFNDVLDDHLINNFPEYQSWANHCLGTAFIQRARIENNLAFARKAIISFQKALTLRPKSNRPRERAITQFHLAGAYLLFSDVNSIDQAFKLYKEYLTYYNYDISEVKIETNDDNGYYNINMLLSSKFNAVGTRLLEESKLDSAVDTFTKSIQCDVNNADSHYQRGVIFLHYKLYSKAIIDFSKTIELDPYNYMALTNRGYIYLSKNQLTEADADFTQAIMLAPGEPFPYNNKALIFMRQNKFAETLYYLNEALKRDPQYADALMNKHIVFKSMNMPDSAQIYLHKHKLVKHRLE